MNLTSIEWTTFSANPLKYRNAAGEKVWGCVHHSPGCINCYSETLAKRYWRGGPFNAQTMQGLTPFLDDAELHKMLTAKTIKGVPVSGSRCFVGDMTDIFGEWVPDALLDRLFAAFALRADVTWQILTKRADRMWSYLAAHDIGLRWLANIYRHYNGYALVDDYAYQERDAVRWAREGLPNVWLGTSAEDQKRLDDRIEHLKQTNAAVRFVSAEPLLEGLDIAKHRPGANRLWVIVGGESGNAARPCRIWWVRNIVGQCGCAGVPVFVKQLGSNPEIEQGCGDCDPCIAGQRCYQSYPLRMELKDRKGGNPAEWPADLRVRQFPGDVGADR